MRESLMELPMSHDHQHHVAASATPVGITAHMRRHGQHDHSAVISGDPAMAAAMERDVRRRFWVALAMTIPLVWLSGTVPGIPSPVGGAVANWVAFVLATPVVWWCGWMFIAGTVTALRRRALDMNVLIATGVLAAYIASVYLTLIDYPATYYDAATMLVTFVLFGHWMEMKSRRGTSDALRALLALVPPSARVLRDGREVAVPTADVVVGDRVRLRPGEKIPVDGELVEGETDVDEALVTGESRPIHKRPGASLVGGSINSSGAVTMRATKVGNDTVLAQIAALVEKAQNSKAPGQRLADKAAAILVVVAVGAGVITFVAWTAAGAPFLTVLTFSISTVVIACPDALGLATPTAVAVGTGLGAKRNILIKDAATLEGVSRVQTIVLDKTGTITEGRPSVTDVQPVEGVTAEALLRAAAPVAAQSTHPLSAAIARAAAEQGIAAQATAADVENAPGMGLAARVDGQKVIIGNLRLLEQAGVELGQVRASGEALAARGRSLTYVAVDGRAMGVIGITDAVRPTSAGAIRDLTALGVTTVLLSGDATTTAERVAADVGITRVFAEVKPEQKADYIKQLQAEGQVTAMVGDGVNDAPALAQADIGIAIGAGTDVAIEAAQVVLMRSDPADIAHAIRLSRATVRKMKQNLAWASVYNLLAIPIAAGALYPSFGWKLAPQVAALLMSASSIIVAVNAVSLRRARI
ncbi:MAG TPA: copper-translocating P-type ATPase [Gemmatimonadaceae bacterium]|nr:copper-translocating P-type ATPase [Gemmatimonadaceae bacterium]